MDPFRSTFDMYNGKQPGDPVRGAKLAVEALAGMGRCENRVLPPRMAIGSDAPVRCDSRLVFNDFV
jgi:hypothetical protein